MHQSSARTSARTPVNMRTTLVRAARRAALPAVLALVAVTAACSRATSSTTTGMSAGGMASSVSAAAALPATVTPLMVERGKVTFNEGSCMRCHGAAGIGGDNGPSLVAGPWLQHSGSYEQIVETVTNGVPASAIKDARHTRAMSGRGGRMELTDEQIREVAAYVWSISRGKK